MTVPLAELLRISICSLLTVWETHRYTHVHCHHLYCYYYCWGIPKLLLALRLRRRVEKQGGRGQLSPLVPHLPFTRVFLASLVSRDSEQASWSMYFFPGLSQQHTQSSASMCDLARGAVRVLP